MKRIEKGTTVKVDVLEFPEGKCANVVNDIAKYLGVVIPANITNIFLGSSSPTEDDRDKLWVKRDVNGRVDGLYVYTVGAWRPLYNFAPGQVIWIIGDSRKVPEGFKIIDVNNGLVTSSVRDRVESQYIKDSTNTYYIYYATLFVGF